MNVSDMNIAQMIEQQRQRIAANQRYFGSVAAGLTADHAPGCTCGSHAAPAQPVRPTYDAEALAGIREGLAAAGRELAGATAAFQRRQATQTAQATADAAARAAGRLTDAERAAVLRRSHAVADAAVAPTTAARMNDRSREVWSRTTPGGQTRPAALPPGFSPSGGL